jgi:rubrerythrin
MSILLSGADVIDLAVQTEMRGERFYRAAAQAADDAEARALFVHLADEELRHKEIFLNLSPQIVVTETAPSAWDDVMGYIEATVDRAFFDEEAPIRAVALAGDVPGMIHQAIAFEQQTLLYFYAVRDLVQRANRPLIDRILAEERSHVRRLSAMLHGLEG